MKSYDWNNPDDRRLAYRESMLAKDRWSVEDNGCHLWLGAKSPKGYGKVRIKGKTFLAHRVRYELEVGLIPDGMHLDHFVCENPTCCNPEHLRPVTPWENALRGNSVSSIHKAKTHCKNGHPLTDGNLVSGQKRLGKRSCRICYNAWAREYKRKRKEAARAV